ncbi:MAG: helix-turn-helix domain-containing protein [Acidimicrobiales bacterium]
MSAAHKDAVRRRIMDAALVCLERNGYRALTTRELLAEAGLSTGTFYNYFPTKEHLFEALAEDLLRAELQRMAAAAPDDQSIGDGLVRFLEETVLRDPDAAVAVAVFRGRMEAGADAAAAIARLNRFVVEEFAPVVGRAQAEGVLRDDLDTEALVELLDIVWDGLGRRQAAGTFQTSFERVGSLVAELVRARALAR